MAQDIFDYLGWMLGYYGTIAVVLVFLIFGPIMSYMSWKRSRGERRGGWQSGPPR